MATIPTPPVIPVVKPPVVTQPSTVQRDGAGVTVNNLASLTQNQRFLDAAKQVLLMKNNMNKDLTDQEAYWKTVVADTAPAGAKRDPIATNPLTLGNPTDVNFREASPGDQMSIANSRESAARAHLSALNTERNQRGNNMADTLKSLESMMAEQAKQKKEKNTDLKDAWDIYNNTVKNNLPVSDELLAKIGYVSTDGRVGVSSWRNNNPGNLKFDKTLESAYGAKKDVTTDYAVFPSEAVAKDAYKSLLLKQKGLPDEAVKKLSEGRYNYMDLTKEGAPAVSKDFSRFTNDEWEQFFTAVKAKEGWQEGTMVNNTTSPHVFYKEADMPKIALLTGDSPTALWAMTDDQISAKEAKGKTDAVRIAVEKIPAGILVENGITTQVAKNIASGLLEGYTDAQIAEVLEEEGIMGAALKITTLREQFKNQKGSNLAELLTAFGG